jgi:hypothetical protein
MATKNPMAKVSRKVAAATFPVPATTGVELAPTSTVVVELPVRHVPGKTNAKSTLLKLKTAAKPKATPKVLKPKITTSATGTVSIGLGRVRQHLAVTIPQSLVSPELKAFLTAQLMPLQDGKTKMSDAVRIMVAVTRPRTDAEKVAHDKQSLRQATQAAKRAEYEVKSAAAHVERTKKQLIAANKKIETAKAKLAKLKPLAK